MAVDQAALKAEIQNDPSAVGYSAVLTAADGDALLANLLNQPRAGTRVNRGVLDSWLLLDAVAPADLLALTGGQMNLFLAIVSTGHFSVNSVNIQAILNGLFPSATAPTTNANLVALRSRLGSRAEALFGAGTIIDSLDVAVALGRS